MIARLSVGKRAGPAVARSVLEQERSQRLPALLRNYPSETWSRNLARVLLEDPSFETIEIRFVIPHIRIPFVANSTEEYASSLSVSSRSRQETKGVQITHTGTVQLFAVDEALSNLLS